MIGLAPCLHQGSRPVLPVQTSPCPRLHILCAVCPASPMADLSSFPVLKAEAKARFIPQLKSEVPIPLQAQLSF